MSALHAGGGAKSWLATFAIGLSTFTVVTAEMLPVGLLTPIVNTLNATIGRAGLLISLPACSPRCLPRWWCWAPGARIAAACWWAFCCC